MNFFFGGIVVGTTLAPAVAGGNPGIHEAAAPQAESSAQDWRAAEASHRGQTNNNVGGPGTPGIIGSSDAAEATSLIMKGTMMNRSVLLLRILLLALQVVDGHGLTHEMTKKGMVMMRWKTNPPSS